MRTLIYIIIALFLIVPVIAYDQREGNNAIPMLAPDPSLKTTDPFYGGIQHPDNSGPSYQLPPIFGGPAPIILDWMNLSEHNEKLNMTTKNIVAINSYALTEDQMSRAGIPVGEENYL